MYRFACLSLCFAVNATANAGTVTSYARSSNISTVSSSSSRVSLASSKGDETASEDMEVELLASGMGRGASNTYEIAVDGDAYQVEVRNTSRQSSVSLYDEDGEIVVGYVASEKGAVIFDDAGLVQSGGPGEISLSEIEDYGDVAALLTNPAFLSAFLEANGETFGGGDDEPPAMWWWIGPAAYMVARCLEVEVSGDLDGVNSWSVGWDC